MLQKKYTFGETELLEQDLIFCRLLIVGFPLELAAEAAKLQTHLLRHISYKELGESKIKQPNVREYLKTEPQIPLPRQNKPLDFNSFYKKHKIEQEKVIQRPNYVANTFSVKRTAFCYLVAKGFSPMFSAEISLSGSTLASRNSSAYQYLKDYNMAIFIAHLQYRFFKENENLPNITVEQLRREALAVSSDDVRQKLTDLEVKILNLRTKFIEPVKRAFEYLDQVEKELKEMQRQLTDLTETEGEDALW